MLVECCICQEATTTWALVSKARVGSPPMLLMDLLVQCVGPVDELLDGICEPDVCSSCEAKLLQFYDATLTVVRKRQEFKERIKKRAPSLMQTEPVNLNPKPKEKLEALIEVSPFEQKSTDDCHDGSNWDFLQTLSDDSWSDAEDNDCEKPAKPKLGFKTNSIEELNEDEPLASIKIKLLAKKANRYCDECEVECPTEEVLRLHVKKFHMKITAGKMKKKNLPCAHCRERFDTEDDYKAHVQQIHPRGSEFRCEVCERMFNTYTLLVAHLATHKPNTCVVCSKSFELRHNLKRHMVTHDPEKRYQCAECGKKFVTSTALCKHRMVHNDSRDHQCPICDKRLRTASHLKRHQASHMKLMATADKNLTCSFCPKIFLKPAKLRRHIQEQHRDV